MKLKPLPLRIRPLWWRVLTIGLLSLLLSMGQMPIALAQSEVNPAERKALFGDLHVHTSYSLDSYFGANPNGPEEAYRFARGEPVTMASGQCHKLKTPLDFTGVTDHAEYLGEIAICTMDENSPYYNSDNCQLVRDAKNDLDAAGEAFQRFIIGKEDLGVCGDNHELCDEYTPLVWDKIQDAATQFNEPGVFTTFKAYEWTSPGNVPPGLAGAGIHRNIIFSNDTVPDTVFSALDVSDPLKSSPNPEHLWAWLDTNCTGECEVIVIPHNANLSQGTAFNPTYYDNVTPIDDVRANTQQRLERLVEVMQTKGESECKTGLGNVDELCNFEKLDRRSVRTGPSFLIEGAAVQSLSSAPICDELFEPAGCINKYSYIREGLKEGIKQEAKIGVNPFKYGFVGATDTHSGIPSSGEEDNYQGNHGMADDTPEYRLGIEQSPISGELDNLLNNPGGLTGVWAEENTRDSIFDAFQRRETFATSGPRIQVRLFGGYEFPEDLNLRDDAIEIAYGTGVPMGSDFPILPTAEADPEFFVWAIKDPKSAPIDRIQIIKGWIGDDGETHEKVYDVACSDQKQPNENGSCPGNKAIPNIFTCSYPQNVGDSELSTVWRDPEFDPNQHAFYYARVIENFTCRWSSYDAIALNKSIFASGAKPFIRERAWSSPIWYSPTKVEPLPAQAVENMSQEDFWNRIIQEIEKHYSTK
ncbi:DUF3604 domain-containing protein [Moorena sp. SIO4G3]|uniref:DUF3604 domain-containing protein n=1 Tax=Moorena sp. SIO4G3 TaxID=2607821 RepID=UPI00142B0705|nr:DUF3604 domain-containing protein [Moorena sp. SIO4G3]NEO80003.1 DUF3604 domain-containing protein [Moorena sp. SIO4G3]